MFEVIIDSVRVSLMNYQRVVILKEKDTDRYLPIWIGPAEADAIAVKLQDVSVPRPLTHDLLGSIITTLGGKVERVVVSSLSNDTFYAKLVVSLGGGKQVEIDSRPSDALAVAVRASVPIFVEEVVMEKAGIIMDKESGKPMADGGRPDQRDRAQRLKDTVTEEELRRMSAFREFIQNLPGLEEMEGGASSGGSRS